MAGFEGGLLEGFHYGSDAGYPHPLKQPRQQEVGSCHRQCRCSVPVVVRAVRRDECLVGVLPSCSIKSATHVMVLPFSSGELCAGKPIISASLVAIVDSWTLLYFNRQRVEEAGTIVENYWSDLAAI